MSYKGIYESSSPNKQLFIFIMLLFLGFLLGNIIGMLGSVVFDAATLTDLQNKDTIKSLKFLQAFTAIGIFIFPPVMFWYLTGVSLDFKTVSRQQVLLTVAIMLLSWPLINILSVLNEGIRLPDFLSNLEAWMRSAEAQAMRITEAFLAVDSLGGLMANLVVIALIPAVGEELLFRGLIQNGLSKWSGKVHLSIWITAFLFSAIHLQFLGFFPRFLIGAMFGYLMVWSGSIWLPIVAHFVNNAAAVLLSYFILDGRIDRSIESIGANEGQESMLLISCAALALLLYVLKQISLPSKA